MNDPACPSRYIYIDANVLIPWFSYKHSQQLHTVWALCLACDAELLITDITRIEIAKHLAEEDFKVIRSVCNERFRECLEELTGIRLPQFEERALYSKAYERELGRVRNKTSGRPWKCLDISHTDLPDIFSQYGKRQGLFSDGTKKHQFADAIVFERLKRTATAGTPVYIFSKDRDFRPAAQEAPDIDLAQSWNELLQFLGAQKDIEELDGIFHAQEKAIVEAVSESINSRSISIQRGTVPDLSKFVTGVDFVAGNSIRHKGEMFIAGSARITYVLPYELAVTAILPSETFRTLEAARDVNRTESQEFCFEAILLAHVRDHQAGEQGEEPRGHAVHGELLLELEAFGHAHYRIMRLESSAK